MTAKCEGRIIAILHVPQDMILSGVLESLKKCGARIRSASLETRRIVASLPARKKCIEALTRQAREGVRLRIEVTVKCRIGGLPGRCLETLGPTRLVRGPRSILYIGRLDGRIVLVEAARERVTIKVGRETGTLPGPVVPPSLLALDISELEAALKLALRLGSELYECAQGISG